MMKTHSKEAYLQKARESLKQLESEMSETTSEEQSDFMKDSPEHVKRVLGQKPTLALFRALKKRGYEDSKIWLEVSEGIPTIGPVVPSGYWKQETKTKNTQREVFQKHPDDDPLLKFRKTPVIADVEGQIHVLDDVLGHVEKQIADEVSASQVEWEPDRGFPTRQSTVDAEMKPKLKIRTISNAAPRNCFSPTTDKIAIPHMRYVIQSLQMLSCRLGLEMLFLTSVVSKAVFYLMNRLGVARRTKRDPLLYKDVQLIEEPVQESTLVVKPAVSLRDVKTAYSQFAAKDPAQNVTAVYSPKEKKYRFFQMHTMVFGNLHSVHAFCRISNSLRFLIQSFLVPCLVYIDDFILFGSEELINDIDMLVGQFFDSIFLKQSPKIFQSITFGGIKVLGMYLIFDSRFLDLGIAQGIIPTKLPAIAVPPHKIKLAILQLQEITKILATYHVSDKRKLCELAEKTAGLIVFCCSFNLASLLIAPLVRSIRAIIYNTDDLRFKNYRNALMANAKRLCEKLADVRPIPIRVDYVHRPVVHLFSDAALEDNEPPTTGGILFAPDALQNPAFADVCPCRSPKRGIPIYEVLAVLASVVNMAKSVVRKTVVFHVDSMVALWWLVKCESPDRRIHRIITEIWNCCESLDIKPIFVYVESDENPSDLFTRFWLKMSKKMTLDRYAARIIDPIFDDLSYKNALIGHVQNPILSKAAESFLQSCCSQVLYLRWSSGTHVITKNLMD